MEHRQSTKRLALSALGGSLSLLGITLAFFIPNLSLTFNIFASTGLMLPLSKEYYRESILSFIAVSIIGALYTNIHILPFVLGTGGFTLFAIISFNKKLSPYLRYGIGFLYSLLAFYICYKLTSLIYVDWDKLNISDWSEHTLYIIFNIVFSIAFVLYQYVIVRLFLYLIPIFKKIRLIK